MYEKKKQMIIIKHLEEKSQIITGITKKKIEIILEKNLKFIIILIKNYIENGIEQKEKTDIEFRIKHIVNSRINSAIKTFNSLKTDKTIEYLGCSIGDYIVYLESKFDENMSWNNYGEYWQIDHIKPIASFNLNNEDELYLCFHHTNTQPLEKTENRFKSDKYTP